MELCLNINRLPANDPQDNAVDLKSGSNLSLTVLMRGLAASRAAAYRSILIFMAPRLAGHGDGG
jgi:hypothetical protein